MSRRSFPQGFFDPPGGSCQVVLVRHGQSIPYESGDPFPLVDGHGDPPLSARGRFQAQQVAHRLADEPISAIYVSTLTRTHQTAAPLAEKLGIEPVVEPDLREVYLGEYEGGRFRELSADNDPAVQRMRESGDWGDIPGAESNAELRARTSAVIERLAREHADEMIVAVCHGGVIGSLLAHAMDVPPTYFGGARNGSISYLYVTPQRWFVRSWNDASHIGPLSHDVDPS